MTNTYEIRKTRNENMFFLIIDDEGMGKNIEHIVMFRDDLVALKNFLQEKGF